MADISKITLPSGVTYNIKDTWARNAIEGFSGGDIIHFGGATNTNLSDDGTEKPVDSNGIEHTLTTANKGELWFQGTQEFLWDGTKWIELGVVDALGSLAYKSTVSVTYDRTTVNTAAEKTFFSGTPIRLVTGNIPVPSSYTSTWTGTAATINVTGTPAGTVSKPSWTGTLASGLTVSPASSGTATYTPSGTVSKPSFSGTAATITVKGTPSGTVTATTSGKTTTVSPASSGTATYTPGGSVGTPTISLKTAGSTTTIKNPTSVTVAKTIATAAPGATAPSNAITYYDVSEETLRLYQLGYTTGASITTSDVTVKTGDAAYQSSQPTWTGTGVRLVTGSIATPDSYSFAGNELTSTGSYTPAGGVSQPTFSGNGVRLTLQDYTPAGSVGQPTFTGDELTSTGSYTPAGTISTITAGTTNKTTTVSKANSGDATFTPEGTINVTLTQTPTGATVSYS